MTQRALVKNASGTERTPKGRSAAAGVQPFETVAASPLNPWPPPWNRGRHSPFESVTIVFYISGHGFGHASRSIELLNTIAARRPGARDHRPNVRACVALPGDGAGSHRAGNRRDRRRRDSDRQPERR
jgi:hypothetical protein